MQRGELELRIEEINVGPGSMLDGRTLGQCNVRGNTGVNVLAVQHPDKSINTNLDPDFILYADDSLICLGTPAQLAALSEIANDGLNSACCNQSIRVNSCRLCYPEQIEKCDHPKRNVKHECRPTY